MSRFFACLKKDIKLLFSKSSLVLFIILPAILIAVMSFALGDASSQTSLIKPFKLAVRNYDDDMVANAVIREIAKVEMFSSVDTIDDSITDEQALADGYASIVTIPEGFFYGIYSLKNMQLEILSNSDMPLESGVVDSIFANILSIITSEQEVWKAEIEVRHGDNLSEKEMRKLWHQNIEAELGRVFGRNSVFNSIDTIEGYTLDQTEHIVTTIVAMFSMFVPLVILASSRTEMSLGIYARSPKRRALHLCMLLSKLLVGIPVLLVISVVPALVLGASISALSMLGILLSYLASFAIFAIAYYVCRSGPEVQVMGSLFILFSLVISGIFYPYSMFPSWAQTLAQFTIPYNLVSAYSGMGNGFNLLAGITVVASLVLGFIVAFREET